MYSFLVPMALLRTNRASCMHRRTMAYRKPRLNAPTPREFSKASFIAFIAAAGGGMVGPSAFVRDLAEFNSKLPPLPNFILPTGRLDLVGITLKFLARTDDRQSYPWRRSLDQGGSLHGTARHFERGGPDRQQNK